MKRLPLLSLAALVALAACSSPAKSTAAGSIAVTAGDSTCDVAAATLPAGQHTFEVTNTAAQVTEIYVYAPGDRILGEAENIGPATKRTLIVDLPAGAYEVACKPGMVGGGIRKALTVTGATASAASTDDNLRAAVGAYRKYVESETQALAQTTATFTTAIKAGDLAKAKAAYAGARLHYERIEPVAESFGDLDPLIDMRAGDGTPFVGFHALEQLIFQRSTLAGATPLADQLTANVAKLAELVKTVEFTPLTLANGAKSLLDEVAKTKVTGEEERYSRIDLLDFAGNVDGAKYVYTALRPALQTRDPQLVAVLDKRFPALIALLDTHRVKGNFSPFLTYDALTPADIKALATEVDAISEPLGKLAAAVSAR